MVRPMLYSLAALLCGASACHEPIANVQWSYVDAPRPLDNVVVYEAIQHDARVGILFRGFETRLQERLEACRIHTAVRHGLPDAGAAAPDPAGSIPAAADASSGSGAGSTLPATAAAEQARLTVVPWGGTATTVYDRSDEVTTKIDGSFKLELYDDRMNKVVWRAVIDVKTSKTPDMSDGRELADTALARLRQDHVIRCSD